MTCPAPLQGNASTVRFFFFEKLGVLLLGVFSRAFAVLCRTRSSEMRQYRVIVNDCYKNKQVTCRQYQQFFVVTCLD